jgi:hypothetical protein
MFTTRPLKIQHLANHLRVGDLMFIRVPTPLFMQVADATGTWTNHVGVVIDEAGTVAESRFPLSGATTLRRFVGRSSRGRVAVMRLRRPLAPTEQAQIAASARRRMGIVYDTGFNLHSRRQFCSRYAREVMAEATGECLGTIESLADLLRARPEVPLWFWHLWYLGRIPWDRQTVTPASLLQSPVLKTVYEGHAR